MKFVCMGYYNEERFARMSEAEQQAMIGECIAYDQELLKKGHFADGVALQAAATATTVHWKNGKAALTDGPFTEAKDKEEALGLISRHPGIRIGPFEVRPVDEEFEAQHPVLKGK